MATVAAAGGTKSGVPGVVTFCTNDNIAALVLPSFHDGRESAAGAAAVTPPNCTANTRTSACNADDHYFIA